MEYTVDNTTFSADDLEMINLIDLKANLISSSHLYLMLPNKQLVIILRAGDFISQEFIEAYKAKGVKSIYAYFISNIKLVETFDEYFSLLIEASNEVERHKFSEKIIQLYTKSFWEKSGESYLAFVESCFSNFFFLNMSDIKNLNDKSVILYSRAIVAASFSVINCLINKIVDPYFIKDIYNSTLMMDYGLVGKGAISYSIIRACEAERNKPGSGILFIEENKLSDEEKEIFINHPKESSHYLERYKNLFYNKEIINIILYHHEKSDGSGFPYGIAYSSITDMETIITFCDNIVCFEEHTFQRGDSEKILKKALAEIVKTHFQLPIDGIVGNFYEGLNWNIDKEIA